jgi:hypothetical protein
VPGLGAGGGAAPDVPQGASAEAAPASADDSEGAAQGTGPVLALFRRLPLDDDPEG